MPKNLELKIEITDFDFVIKTLNSIGAEYLGVLQQKDIYYKNPNGLLKLRVMPSHSELIFYNRNEKTGDRWSDYKVLKIENAEEPEKFFNGVLEPEITVEKARTLFLYKNTRIHLDEVKNLGKFLELETIVEQSLDDAKERFDFLVEKLRLDLTRQIRKSYKNLIEEKTAAQTSNK